MTFCIAMKVKEGIVGIADTRITTGVEWITAKKISIIQRDRHAMLLMTSGLRSARDKALTYFNEVLENRDQEFNKLYKAVNAFAAQVRLVASEDKAALDDSGVSFNLHTLIGGQLENDPEPKLYMLYPQGNWVEVSQGTPYYVIGESSYGKPLLDRALTYDTDMKTALKMGILAFDATRAAATDVSYPVDVVWYQAGSYKLNYHRYTQADLAEASKWWENYLREGIDGLPSDWVQQDMGKKKGKVHRI